MEIFGLIWSLKWYWLSTILLITMVQLSFDSFLWGIFKRSLMKLYKWFTQLQSPLKGLKIVYHSSDKFVYYQWRYEYVKNERFWFRYLFVKPIKRHRFSNTKK